MTKIDSNTLFQAEWPESLQPTPLGKVVETLYLLTPIGIIHSIAFWVGRFLIHPASATHLLDEEARERLLSLGGRIVEFKTPDGETLEGLLFKSRVGSGKGIVCALGNYYCFDHASDQVSFFREQFYDADLLILNYRGVGKSSGSSSPRGLALDVYTACEYLHKVHDVDPSQEIVYGHSLGGYAAVKGGALFQKAHPDERVSVASDRSFCTLSEAANQIAGYFFYLLAVLLRWELDATKEWEVFRGKKVIIYDKQDGIIPFPASFFKAVENSPETCFIEMQSEGNQWIDPHLRSFTPSEASEIGSALN